MKLTTADRVLVTALAGPHAEDVLAILADRSDVLVAMGGGVGRRSLSEDLRDWLVLVARVLRSGLRGSGAGFDSIVLDRTPKALPGRLDYVQRFRPAEKLAGVTATTSLLWPGLGASLRVLGALLRAVLAADRREPSELTYRAVQVATACLQAVSHARHARLGRAYVFRPYRLESPIVSAMLMTRGFEVHVVVGTTPLAAHIRRLVASKAILCTSYQIDEMRQLQPLGPEGAHELWGPTELVQMEAAYDGRVLPDNPIDVGVYTQGFWVRLLIGSIDAESGAPHRELEDRFLRVVERYAQSRPDVRVHLFPHPMERTRFRDTGEHGFGDLLGMPNVEAHFGADENSVLSFDRVGLGLTTVSTVGFDRLHLGLRTLFFVGESDFLDPRIPSPFQSLFFSDEESLLAAIDEAREATNADFMEHYFDDAYGEEWRPWRSSARPVRGDHDTRQA